jgi:hypothetical protein
MSEMHVEKVPKVEMRETIVDKLRQTPMKCDAIGGHRNGLQAKPPQFIQASYHESHAI